MVIVRSILIFLLVVIANFVALVVLCERYKTKRKTIVYIMIIISMMSPYLMWIAM